MSKKLWISVMVLCLLFCMTACGEQAAQANTELEGHKAAKETFNKISGRIPTIKELTAEYEKVLSQKQRDFAEYRNNRSMMRELLTVKANVDIVTGREAPQKGKKEKQHAL